MEPRRAMLIVVPALGVVLCLAYFRLSQPQNAGPAADVLPQLPRNPSTMTDARAATIDEVAALREQVASLRAEMTLLRQHALRQPTDVNGTVDRADVDPQSSALARADAVQERQAQMAAIDAVFRRQSLDPTWSASTSSLIKSALSRDDVGHIQADSIDCRSETCRVEIHDDGTGRLGKSMPILALQIGQTLPTITGDSIEQPDGSSTMVLYLSSKREGAFAR